MLSKTKNTLNQIDEKTKMGDLRKLAKEIKKDHELAMELWESKKFHARLLAILIMDKKFLSQKLINKLDKEMQQHPESERNQLIDWLMANQLARDKKGTALMESWENSPSPLQRRIFWYYQGRLRWMGKTPPPNSEQLLVKIENEIEKEEPEVQWAMNFTAGWIGVYEKEFRTRCVAMGEKTGLYKNQMVSKGCTPDYLPKFIAIESEKRNL